MQMKDTPKRVSVQLIMRPEERTALKALAAADGTNMTQWLVHLVHMAAKARGIPLPEAPVPSTEPRRRRERWRPKPFIINGEQDAQWRAFVRAMGAIRGREETQPEWDRIHALYWGVKSFEHISVVFKAAKKWRQAGSPPTVPADLGSKFEALLEFEVLKKKWFAAWSKRTGYSAHKAKERRLRDPEKARRQEAARQAKHQKTKREERAAHLAAFELEHCSGPDDTMEVVFDAAAE